MLRNLLVYAKPASLNSSLLKNLKIEGFLGQFQKLRELWWGFLRFLGCWDGSEVWNAPPVRAVQRQIVIGSKEI